jgi:hypothetical protein
VGDALDAHLERVLDVEESVLIHVHIDRSCKEAIRIPVLTDRPIALRPMDLAVLVKHSGAPFVGQFWELLGALLNGWRNQWGECEVDEEVDSRHSPVLRGV